jgi:hypothetical protein
MKASLKTLTLLGLVLSLAASGASAQSLRDETEDSAQVLAELIQKGHIQVDPASGTLRLNSSVLSILREYQLLDNGNPETMMIGGCGASEGDGRRCSGRQ